ncbi:hypothetical protein CA54_03050 [Symmachiella macrocystis]|uniref:Uncharacterized protein n=1 Tax=Symmachiella macrocystis TaxID=2527985 RepID=A0A5C6BHH6_9PLAN|nr:hypothetical protein CA54_03050 [Symmachiella macrocystis]
MTPPGRQDPRSLDIIADRQETTIEQHWSKFENTKHER